MFLHSKFNFYELTYADDWDGSSWQTDDTYNLRFIKASASINLAMALSTTFPNFAILAQNSNLHTVYQKYENSILDNRWIFGNEGCFQLVNGTNFYIGSQITFDGALYAAQRLGLFEYFIYYADDLIYRYNLGVITDYRSIDVGWIDVGF
jgi:hypothetical protein